MAKRRNRNNRNSKPQSQTSNKQGGESASDDADSPPSKEIVQIKSALETLPPEKRQPALRAVHSLEMRITSGPIPSPEVFREYEDILPGSADRILAMAELQQAHRHSLESDVI